MSLVFSRGGRGKKSGGKTKKIKKKREKIRVSSKTLKLRSGRVGNGAKGGVCVGLGGRK